MDALVTKEEKREYYLRQIIARTPPRTKADKFLLGVYHTLLNALDATPAESKVAALDELRRSNRYFGVRIESGGCHASAQLAGKIYSFRDVPALPVGGCEAVQCHCSYAGQTELRNLEERRSGRDRRRGERMGLGRRTGMERRVQAAG